MIGSCWSQQKRAALSYIARKQKDEHEQWPKAYKVTILSDCYAK